MNCDWIKENAALYVYEELPDDQRHEFEQHVERCAECKRELAAVNEFKVTMAAVSPAEPSPNLLAGARMKLQEALETASQSHGWSRFAFDFAGWLTQVKLSPALTVALLIFGFGAGTMATYSYLIGRGAGPSGTVAGVNQPNEAAIAGIRNIVQEPNSNKVQINYDTLTPAQKEGSLDDPAIQQLLLFAARNNTNSGNRIDAVSLLVQKPEDSKVREALVYALRYDKNVGVRLKALEALRPYVKEDVRVRDAMLEALMGDANPGVRAQALGVVKNVRQDASVRAVLMQLADKDTNVFIKNESKRLLAQTPEMD
ncbi:MAG: HEAT repeat domain-containing protein [Candidatus Koribacter versatilis]|uniref:HEAT repeat domain-containing protein n=1 Tax=Candidatus Korobacter versatilis TaxID=658062 RepID=A0A932A7T6_9BACT|nr:HEAT repeat domain-containing protein [Candidatus Koribacter versatilis]